MNRKLSSKIRQTVHILLFCGILIGLILGWIAGMFVNNRTIFNEPQSVETLNCTKQMQGLLDLCNNQSLLYQQEIEFWKFKFENKPDVFKIIHDNSGMMSVGDNASIPCWLNWANGTSVPCGSL